MPRGRCGCVTSSTPASYNVRMTARRANLLCPLACVFGASVICVDIFVRLLPGKKDFRIQDSNTFLACSLSLSFGVMVSRARCPVAAVHGAYSRTRVLTARLADIHVPFQHVTRSQEQPQEGRLR